MRQDVWVWLALFAGLIGCSGEGNRGLRVGMNGPQAGASGAGAGGIDNPSGGASGAIEISDNALEVEIEHDALAVELVTLRCAGECAEVEAVARGGHPRYSFAWDDGPATPVRMLCPDATTKFAVAVTDSSIETEELSYEARTERAEVTAEVLRCEDGDAGVPQTTESDCGPGASGPLLLVERHESAGTLDYTAANGNDPDYVSSPYGAQMPLAIVATAQREVHLGTCTKLLLAGNAAGTQAVGWDDTLVIEYRGAADADIDKRWLYGVVSPITHLPTGEALTSLVTTTVAGWDLEPPVPNPLPFGHAPLAIDVMHDTPSGAKDFELTLHVLDTGGFGSTTEIWAIPR